MVVSVVCGAVDANCSDVALDLHNIMQVFILMHLLCVLKGLNLGNYIFGTWNLI